MKTGVLYLVATPIGNIADISERAKQTLASVDVIAAETPSRAKKLLAALDINCPKLISYRRANSGRQTIKIIGYLQKGRDVALISDAGNPLIADPGHNLVREAIFRRLPIQAIPGAAAFLVALIISGFNSQRFLFLGYFPRHPRRQRALWKQLSVLDRKLVSTVVFYEVPTRIIKMLDFLADKNAKLNIMVARELTKKFETVYRGDIGEVKQQLKREANLRGELTVVIGLR